MIYVTGCYNKDHNYFRMHDRTLEEHLITSTVYAGYSLEGMKKKYREDHGLEGKHINWVIVGIEY